jgi:hypothetical protein
MVYYPKCSEHRGPRTLPAPRLAIYRPGSWVISRDSKLATDQQLCSRLIG